MFKKLFQKAIQVEPNFYENGSNILGVFPLTESTDKKIFPKYPEMKFLIDGHQIEEFRLLVMSETTDTVVADVDYREGLKRLAAKVVKETKDTVTISSLTHQDLVDLFKR